MNVGGIRGRARRRAAMVALLLLVAAAACSGDDDEDRDAGSAEEPAAETEAAGIVDPYDGHASETYDGTTNWLCHPDLADDECRDLSATEVSADGTTQPADLAVAEAPAVDCFYVYPTVSSDPGMSSDLQPGDAERLTLGAQAAPYASTCRMFAPVYRQVTLSGIGGAADSDARELAYGDAVDAWKTYISQYNDGRGVVLIGHSQGASVLRELIAAEIDPQPELRSRLVSAVLMGGTVFVPDGADVGGSFQEIPACREPGQVGCVISFSTYAAERPPTESGIFGRAGSDGDRALCVDPVALAGGNGLADAIVPVTAPLIGGGAENLAPGITTRYVVLPEVLEASCQRTGDFDYFAVGRASDSDVRPIDRLTADRLSAEWGLHLQDANLPLGDLLDVVAAQADAFTAGGD